jgi:hypothetical protein
MKNIIIKRTVLSSKKTKGWSRYGYEDGANLKRIIICYLVSCIKGILTCKMAHPKTSKPYL